MERKLSRLFDFQRFEGNKELQSLVDSVSARYAKQELNLDEMMQINAAGTPDLPQDGKRKEKKQN